MVTFSNKQRPDASALKMLFLFYAFVFHLLNINLYTYSDITS